MEARVGPEPAPDRMSELRAPPTVPDLPIPTEERKRHMVLGREGALARAGRLRERRRRVQGGREERERHFDIWAFVLVVGIEKGIECGKTEDIEEKNSFKGRIHRAARLLRLANGSRQPAGR